MNKFNVIPKWNVSDNVKILVTEKNFLSKKYFNLSYTNNNYFITKKNREYLSSILPSTPHYIKQVHGKKIVCLDGGEVISHVCDGIITKTKNQVISVLTADCVPVVISSLCGSIICILHVGRKGAEYNIINSAFKILKECSYVFEAWIGPAISKNYYLVDIYVKNLFEHIDSQYSRFFCRNCVDENLFHMDLIGIVSYQLNNNGVKNISYSELCTVKNNSNYFSHRLNSDSKRFGTFVWSE